MRVEDANLNLADLRARFDTTGYLSPHSDVVALLVFNHQLRMMNLLTRIGWEARMLAHDGRSQAGDRQRRSATTAVEVVDYMLFVDEAPLAGVRGSSGFAESFSARGPRDSKGRSLRDLDLQQRLFTYPCSYMIYSEAFEQLAGCREERRLRASVGGALRRGARAEVLAALASRPRSDHRDPSRDEEGSAGGVYPSPVPTLSAGSANGFCNR